MRRIAGPLLTLAMALLPTAAGAHGVEVTPFAAYRFLFSI